MAYQTAAKALSYAFGPFRPSDRKLLLDSLAAQNGPEIFMSSLEIFLEGWAKADWLEAYNVERVGIWIAENCNSDIKKRVLELVSKKIGTSLGNRKDTYSAIKLGIDEVSSSRAFFI